MQSRQAEVAWLDKADAIAEKAAGREREAAAEAERRERAAEERRLREEERVAAAAQHLAALKLQAELNSPEARRAALERRCVDPGWLSREAENLMVR